MHGQYGQPYRKVSQSLHSAVKGPAPHCRPPPSVCGKRLAVVHELQKRPMMRPQSTHVLKRVAGSSAKARTTSGKPPGAAAAADAAREYLRFRPRSRCRRL